MTASRPGSRHLDFERTMSLMRKLQSQGVHHITLVGADRQTSIDNIAPVHLADAIEQHVTASRETLSDDRSPKDPYRHARPAEVQTPDE